MFRLHKWFLDCVTPSGDAVVVYAATLRFGLLRLGYSAVLCHLRGATTVQTRLGRPAVPEIGRERITFADARLRLAGTWRGRRLADERLLWASPRGQVRWHCHQPLAEVELELAGETMRGTGYVEHLALDVAPWHLPIAELRWGRCHADGRSLVWIQWEGPAPLRLCLRDGVAVEVGQVGDGGFSLATGERLELDAPQVLRDGQLGRTVLAQRMLRWLPLPRSVRAMQETKWLASGRLVAADGVHEGMALHEVVRWA